ncbi:MAG: hypothetical protein COA40_12700 [Aequorivita sp.]|jgi:hypothetical protein|nr:MAG: hypothetical protein COA40_12700 [Aequorivita sp.]
MNENFKYLIYIFLTIIGIGILPNLILRPIWSSGIAALTILLNGFLIPISLLRVIKWINKKFDKDWWILNFALIIGTVCLSVYLGFLNWANWADNTPGGWGSNNVDKGTYMILNLELTIGLGIVGIALLIKIITKIGEWKSKTYS